ncbi:MAG: FkbM family methyltransferase [Selenomonadaceae bacterium]|nr:FkbM family methyltransferase [Selenomonadaceae bacterium]
MNIVTYKTVFFDGNPISFLEKINVNLEYYEALRERLKIKKIVDKNFVRLGKPNDGGYIMVDNFNVSEGIAYSFGICDDVSWDLDMVRRDYDVFMYDPTIDALPFNHEKFHFFQEGVLGIEIKEQHMNTLENFIKRNGHESKSNMILKMDVEGAEWSFLSTVTSETLNQFDQIIFEFHDMTSPKDQSVMNATLACLTKINRTHSLVHLHANSCGSALVLEDKILFPNALELTYVKTSNYELVDDENIFLPIPLDQPCNGYQEISLGYWNRKFNNVVKIL